VARAWPGASLAQRLLLEGELRVTTTLEAVRAACELAGVTAPQLQPPSGAEQIVLLSVIQLGGVTLTQVNRALSKSAALPIAWQLHQRTLAAALEPLTRLEASLRRFARWWPIVQWSTIGATLAIGAAAGLQQLQAALRQGLLTMAGFVTLALVQYLLRRWLRRYFANVVLGRLLGDERAQ
jgi:hypothetical protein